MTPFPDRAAAGRLLAEVLAAHRLADPVVLALPRGGVPVAAEIAAALRAPLDLVMARKIGVPGRPELAAGAVVNGDDPQIEMNADVLAATGLRREDVAEMAGSELAEIRRRRERYLSGRATVPIAGRTAIVVDDGIATGATMRVALRAVARRDPGAIVLAVPVAPADSLMSMRDDVDDIVCLRSPASFYAVGQYYRDFHQVTDDEVVALLAAAIQT